MKTQFTLELTVKGNATGLEDILWTAWELAVKTGIAVTFRHQGKLYTVDEETNVLELLNN